MKVLLLGTIAFRILCTILVISPTLAKPRPPRGSPPSPSLPPQDIKYTKETWTFKEPASYKTLIGSLRRELSGGKVCGISVTSESPIERKKFILVEITNKKDTVITLAFRASNVYYVGFMVKLKGGDTVANFVKEDFEELRNGSLFKDAKTRLKLPHGGNYVNLEKVAKIDSRGELKLGVNSLSPLIDKIYEAKNSGQDSAKFALVAIQMIAEATRFKYIEKMVDEDGTKEGTFTPDELFLRLENNWGLISNRIHTFSSTTKNCQDKKVKIQILPEFPEWDNIKPIIGLLNFKSDKRPPPASLLTKLVRS